MIKSSRSGDIKLKTSSKVNQARGPLKALPNALDPIKSVTKRLQLSSTSSNTSGISGEEQALYDEYLLSTLMMVNVKQNCTEAKNQAEKELCAMWNALTEISDQVVQGKIKRKFLNFSKTLQTVSKK